MSYFYPFVRNSLEKQQNKKSRNLLKINGYRTFSIWHARKDSNLQPSEPESDALSIALRARMC